MAIINNISTEIGDIIRIQTDVPVIGVITLYTFLDETVGETGTRYFEKYFRYSVDGGLNYSNWEELTTINIQDISVTRKDQFVLEYRYTRAGVDATGNLEINSVELSGDFEALPHPIYKQSVFYKFFDVNDVNVLGWALNVLEKLYKKGIIPDYIKRL